MRIVSLVPSLTLTLFELGCSVDEVVGRTPWCIHPAEKVSKVPVIGGTKTPNIKKILSANPDLVVLDREENPKAVYEQLIEAGIEVFVCTVEHPKDVPQLLRELGGKINRKKSGEAWASALEVLLQKLHLNPLPPSRVAPMIWHDPLMSVGPHKYAGGVLTTLGLQVPALIEGGNGYPVVTPELLMHHGIEGLLLSSEPHPFALEEGEAIAAKVSELGGPKLWSKCIDGEALTWFGTHTASGLESLRLALK